MSNLVEVYLIRRHLDDMNLEDKLAGEKIQVKTHTLVIFSLELAL